MVNANQRHWPYTLIIPLNNRDGWYVCQIGLVVNNKCKVSLFFTQINYPQAIDKFMVMKYYILELNILSSDLNGKDTEIRIRVEEKAWDIHPQRQAFLETQVVLTILSF